MSTMKKPTELRSISRRTVERDLKALFQGEDRPLSKMFRNDLEPIDFEGALQLFDDLNEEANTPTRESKWSHPSVLALKEPDPIAAIILRARHVVLDAIERGWSGPPYNPFTLAEICGIR